jgi:transcriptional regulator with XRE-family HTH domain
LTGEELKAQREELGLSLSQLARACGYASVDNGVTLLRRYERDEREVPPWLPRMLELFRRFGVPPDFIAPE